MSPDPLPAVAERASPLWLWLYGNGNIWGSIAGLFGVGLLFAGVIGTGWLAIVAGLYAIGAVAAPRTRMPDFSLPGGFTPAQLQARLDDMLAALKPAAGADVMMRMQSIRDQALGLMPKLDTQAMTAEDRYSFIELLSRYLPETLANYLKLPPLYRRYHALRDNRTAEQLLHEQVTVLDGQLAAMTERVFRADAQDLLVQGRFLQDKFKRGDLLDALRDGAKP